MNLTPTRCSRPLNHAHQTILALAGRPEGVSTRCLREALGITTWAASSALHAAERAERTLCVQHPGDLDHRRRWFTDRDAAEAWMSGTAPARVEYPSRPPKLSAIGEPIKSLAQQPGPQIKREKAPQGHSWRPDAGGLAKHTAGASKIAAQVSSGDATAAVGADKIQRGPSPVYGLSARRYVDPATVERYFTGVGLGFDPETKKPWGEPA